MSASPEPARATRLAGFLREDPANPLLLADACDAALAAGLHALAAQHIERARVLGLDRTSWTWRCARLCIAQRKLDEASGLLTPLLAAAGASPALVHDLAYVRLLQGEPQAARDLLAPWVDLEAMAEPDTLEALQVLWLRAGHRLDQLEDAWAWIAARMASGQLRPAACGVASLVALDLGRFDDARRLADTALATGLLQVEALVTRGTLALADRNTARAEHLLQQALQCNPEDGRTWSTLGLCSLQAQDWIAAEARLARAVRTLPAHVGSWHALGWSRVLQQDVAGALDAFGQALQIDRNFAESHGALGLALALAGRRDEAEAHLQVARRLDPANVTGRYAQALLAGEAGDLEHLLALADRLLDRPGFGRAKLSAEVRAAVAARGAAERPQASR